MSILNVEHLSHDFGGRRIFEDVSFRLLRGEHVGLVGANGEGKSTFIKIITDSLMPDRGKIEWAKNINVGYLDQHASLEPGSTIQDVLKEAFKPLLKKQGRLEEIYGELETATSEEMNDLLEEMGELQTSLDQSDIYTIDPQVEEMARAFDLTELGLDRDVSELSGGQRSKVLLAKLLLSRPDILLLDEPTNYLDVAHIEWLEGYLQNYENAFILISHDVPFLNRVVNLIYHVENAEINRYVGNYDSFLQLYEQEKNQQEAAFNRQQKEIADLKDFVARNKARVSTRNMAMSRQKKLDKMDRIELSAEKTKPDFGFQSDRAPSRFIFETKDLVIGYDEPLSRPLNLTLERGQKIALIGANGIGKSTLLKSLMGLIPALEGGSSQGDFVNIGYFEQEASKDLNQTCLQAFWDAFPRMNQAEARTALARCGLRTQHMESLVGVLSGGEQAKLRLAKLINLPHNVLVLDEPTNHLDPLAKEALQEALTAYKGTVLMVCHEPEFYEGFATDVWNGRDWSLKL